jgi:carboxypeptidase family protein/TonB-dependent receptor-like protein
MQSTQLLTAAILTAALTVSSTVPVHAQAVTTGSVSGTVTSNQGQLLQGAQVQVVNRSTGFSAGVTTGPSGRYTIAGLEVGSNYGVTVRSLGYEPQTRENIPISLSQVSRADFVLAPSTVTLAGVVITAEQSSAISPSHTGTVTAITDTALRRLPTLNRNFTDFVALTPQVSTTLFNGGLSGGGANNRYNNVQIDGTSEADVFGLGSTGQPGGQANGKSIGLEAVKEYTVSLSPFDVRQGFFAGLLINAVTKSGTNDFSGTAFGVSRNQSLTRDQPYLNDYQQKQYGFSVGGPIVRDRAFFFISPEFQTRTTPASDVATFIGQARADSFVTALSGYSGLNTVGNFGLVNNRNPLTNIFVRFDVNLPHNSQLVLRHNYGKAEDDNFSRSTSLYKFSDNGYFFNSTKQAPAMQLRTLFASGAYNELMAGYTQIRDRRTPFTRSPEITVLTPGFVITSGSERFSHGNELDQDIFEVTENFTMPVANHRLTIGTQNEFLKFRNLFAQSTFGVWEFSSIDSLRNALPRQYIVGVPLEPDGAGGVRPGGDGAVRFKSALYSLYAQDEWAATSRLNITVGLRMDVPVFKDKPPTNPSVLATYGRNTADIPSGNKQWSPRLGVNWDVTGDAVNQLRGGVGLFTGRPAYVWLSNAFQNSGMGAVALLTCNGAPTAANRPPAFSNATIASPPSTCGGGSTAALISEIDLADPNLKYPQNLRATFGYDRRLFQNWVTTAEFLYTRGVNGLFYRNVALAGPQGTNPEGRVIYGTAPNTPVLIPGGRSQIFDVTNQSKDHAFSLTGGIQRRYANNFEGSVFYTLTKAYDVQSFTSSTAFSQYRFGRVWAGDLDDQTATRSTFEQRHRIVGQATYSFPTLTDVSLIYFGESGGPFSYIASGDLNGDGITLNDPVYVPNNAADPAEMTFLASTFFSPSAGANVNYTPAQQAAAFEQFITSISCLNESRGRILARNVCDAPWVNTLNVSVRQSLRTFRLQHVTLQLDVFNFLNLLNKKWGLQSTPGTSPVTLLTSGAYTGGTILTGRPTYRFNPNYEAYVSNNIRSNYQMQLQARYGF